MKAPLSNALKITGSNQQISFRPSSNRSVEEQKQTGPLFMQNQRHITNIRTAQFEQLVSPGGASSQNDAINDTKNRQISTKNQTAYQYKYPPHQQFHQHNQQQSFDNSKESWKSKDIQYKVGKDLRTTPSIEEKQERSYFQTSIDNTTQYRSQMDHSPLENARLNNMGGANSQLQKRDEQASVSSKYTHKNQQANRFMVQNEYYQSQDSNQQHQMSSDNLNQREETPSEQDHEQASGIDMEQIIMNLHNKMKNLESKYIDLANFYKKELVTKKGLSHYSPIRNPAEASRFKHNREKSPHYQPTDLDQHAESSIIQELLQEKNDLERELANMIQLQVRQQEGEHQILEKIDNVERENYELKQLVFKGHNSSPTVVIQSSPVQSQIQIEQAQSEISQVLNQFENEFLQFINQNYNSFTEKDVVTMFGKLKSQMSILVTQFRQQLFNSGHQQQIQQVKQDSAMYIQLEQDRQQLIDQHKNDLSQFELTHEYQIQNIKKSVFDLKSKQEMAKLDLKKLGLNLNNLTKATSEIQALFGGSDSVKKFQPINSNMSSIVYQERSQSQNKRATLDPRSNTQFNQISPLSPSNQNMQQKIIHDIQSYVQAINITFNDVHQRIISGDRDIKNLSQIENDNINNFQQLKDNLQIFTRGLDSLKEQSFRENQQYNTIAHFTEEEQLDSASKHILQLKAINDKLFQEQQNFGDKYNQLKLENNSLKSEIDKLGRVSPHKQVLAFDYSGSDNKQRRSSSIGPNYQNQQREVTEEQNQERHILQSKLTLLQNDNENLKRSIKTLNRYVDDKNLDIERLNHEVFRISSQVSSEKVATEQIQFYQDYADQQIEKLRQLIRLSQKFLYSMKQLQKAVHRKENNVQQEKVEFETTRKELEQYIKDLKKELDQLTAQANQQQERNQQSKSQRQETLYQKNIRNKPQNNSQTRPQISLSQRAQENDNYKKQSLTQVNYQNAKSFNVNNPYTISNSMTTAHLQEKRGSRDQSPLFAEKLEMYRSIDPIDRRPIFSSYEKNVNQSPKDGSVSAFNLRQPQARGATIESSTASFQLQNMKNDINLLKQEVLDVKNERDHLKLAISNMEREKSMHVVERQQIEFAIDKEKQINESIKRGINELQLEKQELIQQLQSQNNHMRCEKEINDMLVQNRRLKEDAKVTEKTIADYKRQFQIMEESVEDGKQLVSEQKEELVKKDIEIDEIRSKYQIVGQGARVNDSSIRELKVKLIAQIESQNDNYKQQIEALQDALSQNVKRLDSQIRKVDQYCKEKVQQTARLLQNEITISNLQLKIEDLESEKDETIEVQQLQEQLAERDRTAQEQSQRLKFEIDNLKKSSNQEKQMELDKLEKTLQQQYEQQLKELIAKNQRSIQDNEQQAKKAKDNLQETVKQRDNKIKDLQEVNLALEQNLQGLQAQLQQQIESLRHKQQTTEKDSKKRENLEQNQIQQKEQQIRDLLQKIEELEDTILRQNNQLSALQAQSNRDKEAYQKQIESKNDDNDELQQQIQQLAADYEEQLQEMGRDNEQALDTKQIEIQNVKQQYQKEKESQEKLIKQRDVEIASLEQEKDQLESELQDELQRVSYESKNLIESKDAQIIKMQKTISNNDKLMREKELKIEELITQNKQLHDQIQQNISKINKESSNVLGTKDQEIQQLKQYIQNLERQNKEQKHQVEELIQEKNEDDQQFQLQLSNIKQDYESKIQSKDQAIQQLKTKLLSTEKNVITQQNEITQLKMDRDLIQNQSSTQIDSLSKENSQKIGSLQKEIQQLQQNNIQLGEEINSKDNQIEQYQNSLDQFQDQQQDIIDKAENQSKSYKQQLQQQIANIKQLENELSDAQKQSQELQNATKEQILEKGKEVIQNQQLYQVEIKQKNQELINSKSHFEKIIRNKDVEIDSLRAEKVQLEAELQDQINEVHQEKGALLSSKEQEIHQQKQQIQNFTKIVKQSEFEIEDLKSELLQINKKHEQSISLLQIQTSKLLQQQDEAEKKVSALLIEKDKIEKAKQQEIAALKEKLQLQVSESQEQVQALQDRLQNSTHVKDKEIAGLSNEMQKLKSQQEINIKQLKNDNNRLEETVQQLQQSGDSQNQSLQTQIATSQQQVKNHAATIKQLQQELQEKEGYLQELEQQLTDNENRIEDLTADQLNINNDYQELQQKFDLLEKENKQIKQQKDHVEQESAQLKQQKTQFEQDYNKSQSVLKDHKQQLSDLENESKYITQLKESLQLQVEKQQKDNSAKEEHTRQQNLTLQQEINKLHEDIQLKNETQQKLLQDIIDLKRDQESKQKDNAKLQKQQEQSYNELKYKIGLLESDIKSQEKQYEDKLNSVNSQLKQTQGERDKSIQQLKDMVSQTNVEKKSLESQLQNQLSETLSQLQQKEKDLKSLQQVYQQNQGQCQALNNQVSDLQDKVLQVEQDNQQYQEALADAEDTREKHQSTLENNRNLIQMLKNELQKSIDKQKAQEQNENKSQQNNELTAGQVEILKQEYEDKMIDLQMRIDEQESELRIKNELVEEANRVIEEFNDEKHELKAKFKHLMQIYEEVEEESSYKEDDEINLESCFDMLEQALSKHQQKIQMKFNQIEQANTLTQKQLQEKQAELNSLQTKMGEVQCELMNAMNKCENNDIEIRKQMDTAQRKIENYKEKLIEKQKHINLLEGEKKKEVSENSSIKDNIELLQKLQKAESELQTYRLANSKKVVSPNQSARDSSSKLDTNRLQQMEDQIQAMKKQLFQAKDQVISSLSDTFSKRIKDLQNTYINEKILSQKLKDIKSGEINQDLNTNIKEFKRFIVDGKFIIIAKLVDKDEIIVIDERKVSESALQFLRSFINSEQNEALVMNSKQQSIIEKLNGQIKETRQDRQEMEQEILLYKQKFLASSPDDLKDLRMIELEDDVGHLTSENIELRMKIKDLSVQNSELRLRVIELNEMVTDVISSNSGGTDGDKILKLVEENQVLQRQLLNIKKKSMSMTNEERKQMENSFLADIHNDKVMGGAGDGDEEHRDMFDESSLINVIQDIGEATPRQTKAQMYKTIERLNTELDQQKQKLKSMTAEIQVSSQQPTLNQEEQSVIDHIKGTLIQFLKNCPLTEKNNEELLAILFSMMDFSKNEIQDVQQYRKKTRATSVNPTTSGNIQTTDPDDDSKKSTGKKSLFGSMFKKKEKDGKGGKDENTTNSRVMSASPIRPIKR